MNYVARKNLQRFGWGDGRTDGTPLSLFGVRGSDDRDHKNPESWLCNKMSSFLDVCACLNLHCVPGERTRLSRHILPSKKGSLFFCLLFFPLVFHLMLLQWSLFSFFSFLPWFNTKAQCFRIFALYVVFFLLSFWSSWWSPVPPLLPFEHWNSHGKDLVQLLVSLLFFGTEQADGIKTSLTSQFDETCKENFQISLLLLSFCILPEQWRLKASWSLGYWAAGMYTSLKAMEILGHDHDMLRNESFQEE